MKVLIVEDDGEKLARLVSVLKAAGVCEDGISEARTSQQAKQLMRTHAYDLLLLDLHIPARLEERPQKDEGVELLRQISERDKYIKPEHVIGVTGFDDALQSAQPVFADALVPIFRYEREAEGWKRKLQHRVEYILETKISKNRRALTDYDYHVGIVTALEKPELEAVLNIPWDWQSRDDADDDTTYFVGRVTTSSNVRVVAASSPMMGMPAAAIIATKIIQKFRPRFLIHCGITAGVRGKVQMGDVLVADPSWDWGSGKFAVNEEKDITFFAAPYQIALREEVRGLVRRLASNENKLGTIRNGWPGNKPPSVLSLVLGPVASGAAVLADGGTVAKIHDQHRKLIGVEMETYGVMAASEFGVKPRPLSVSMKAVCDFGDGAKDDQYQSYAAYCSARCMQALVEDYLLPS